MEKDLFPEQEDGSSLSQEPEEEVIPLPFSPEKPTEPSSGLAESFEGAEDTTLFEPLEEFQDVSQAEVEEDIAEGEQPSESAEIPSAELEQLPKAEAAAPSEPEPPSGAEDAASDEPVPPSDLAEPGQDFPALTAPQTREEITPDESAMRFYGMRNHGEEEPAFDMSILDDPELALPQEQSSPNEDEESDQEYRDNGKTETPPAESIEEETPLAKPRPVRKGRPKRKRSEWLFGIPQIVSTVVWLVLIVVIGVTAGRMLWVCAADVLAFGREDRAVTVTVYESDTMEDIIDKLYDNGLIRYKGLFGLYASISHAEEDIQPGIYDLNTLYDYHALVNFMSPRSSREVISLTIPEGYSCRQIFSLLEEKRICTAVDIGAYAASGELEDYWFLEGVARGDKYCLEGYLFPDTYEFYKNSTPKEALERMLDNFEVKFSEEMRAQLEALNANLTGGYTVRDITTVASLIEKESAAPAESPRIAGVIYNRLFRWGDTPAYLNIDASVIYALDGKTDLTREDLQVDSPYNTYTNIGLPPTPISNPGLASLQAALSPEDHNYYYYVLNPSTGMHQFSTTYEEHSGYVAQFAEAQ